MLDRLASVVDRYDELNNLLSDPEVVADYTQVEKYAREQAAMREGVELARQYRKLSEDLSQVKDIIRGETEEELVSMAKDEQVSLEKNLILVESDLKLALVPKDPNDDKNVIIEIRAGTGGDEAGLFASNLYPVSYTHLTLPTICSV